MSKKGGDKTQSTTQTVAYDPEIMQRMTAGYNATAGMVSPFLKVPNYGVAGFTPDQEQGFKLARDIAQGTFTQSPVRSIPGSATMATAAQISPEAIQAGMNPYLSSVLTPALNQMRREKNAAGADIGARSAAAGAFGGSREALQRALLDRSHAENASSTVGQMMAQAFESSAGRAEADASRRQQTALTNASAANDFALRAPTIEDGLANNDQQRKIAALQLLLGIGGTQQQLAQSSIDLPYTALQRLLAVTPNVAPSTTTQTAPDNSPSTFQQLLGLAGNIALAPVTGGGSLLGNLLK